MPHDDVEAISRGLGRSCLHDEDSTFRAAELPPEILYECFHNLEHAADLRAVALTCRAWAACAVGQLWARPLIYDRRVLISLNRTLAGEHGSAFHYREFVRRLNLVCIAADVEDRDLLGFLGCSKLERLVLGGCKELSERMLCDLLDRNRQLISVDFAGIVGVRRLALLGIASCCPQLQGLNLSDCASVDDDGLVAIAEGCRDLRRVKLSKCTSISDRAVLALSQARLLLEVDLDGCPDVSAASVKQLLRLCPIRDLRLSLCGAIGDECFAELKKDDLPALRGIDLTGCSRITDLSVFQIVNAAAKLRSLTLTRCINLTDRGVVQISRLGKYLHHLHLGHCSNLTDRSITFLVKYCSRLRYIDLACCYNLTDEAVVALSGLARVKRIGLVKCNNVTNEGILALANASNVQASLERIHLSYCTRLTLESVSRLLSACPGLTHISLTGVLDFLRNDLIRFCRPAPAEFNQPQAAVL